MAGEPAARASVQSGAGLKVPRHLGVIMDGNGRWAKSRGKRRTEGHVEGVKALRGLVGHCIPHGVGYLTVFCFSSEEWSTPPDELAFVFKLRRRMLGSDLRRITVIKAPG